MTKPRPAVSSIRASLALALVIAVTLAMLGANPAAAAPIDTVQGNSVTIPAGGTATISVRGVALQPGASLPTAPLSLATQAFPADKVRTALYYAIDWGYADSDPGQVALAVWWMQDGSWRDPSHDVAARITDAASASPGTPSWNPDGRSLLPLVSQGQVTLSPLALTPGQNPAVGDGTLTVQNASGQDLIVYLPYGTLFTDGTASALLWAVAPTTPAATPSAEGQQATATEVPVATDTPEPASTDTPAPGYKDGYTPVPQDTPTGTYKAPPATATSLPDAPSPAPSDTPQPTDTVPPQPTSTSEPFGPPPVVPQAPGPDQGQPKPPPANSPPQQPQSPAQDGQVQAQNQQQSVQTNTQQASAPIPLPTGTSSAGGSTSAPSPVRTAVAGQVQVPSPVNTGVPGQGQLAPPAQPTGQSTIPSGGQATPTLFQTPTLPVKVKPTLTPVATTSSSSSSNNSSSSSSSKVTPTQKPIIKTPLPAPTPAPQPGGPVINASGDKSSSSNNAAGGNVGSRPTTNPVTGAGPSSLPLWLTLASALIVLAGWMLRRLGRRPLAPQPAGASSEERTRRT